MCSLSNKVTETQLTLAVGLDAGLGECWKVPGAALERRRAELRSLRAPNDGLPWSREPLLAQVMSSQGRAAS